jgi:hypothetical protein
MVGRMYEKFGTFLRVGVCVNRMIDLGLNKGLENLQRLRQKLVAITDRFADQKQRVNDEVDKKALRDEVDGLTKQVGVLPIPAFQNYWEM